MTIPSKPIILRPSNIQTTLAEVVRICIEKADKLMFTDSSLEQNRKDSLILYGIAVKAIQAVIEDIEKMDVH